MAIKKEKEKEEVKVEEAPANQTLMTQEEYDKLLRAKVRENINRVTRVIGMLAIIVIVVLGIIPVFCLSAFGLIFTKGIYQTSWEGIGQSGAIKILCVMMGSPDGVYYPGMEWLGTTFMTLLMIGVILGMTYLLTYNIADLIQFFKSFFRSTRNLVLDISHVAKDGVEISMKGEKKKLKKQQKKQKKPVVEEREEEDKDLFGDGGLPEIKIFNINDDKPGQATPAAPETPKDEPAKDAPRRKIRKEQNTGGYTDEQLDRLLRGESIN